MMDNAAILPKNFKIFVLMCLFALIGGYIYVTFMSFGYRGVIFINGSVLFFAFLAIFLRDIKTFLVFLLLFGLAFNYGYYLTYRPPDVPAPPFSVGIRLETTNIILIMCYIHWGLSLATRNQNIGRITFGGKVGALFLLWIIVVFVSGLVSATNLNYSMYEGIVYIEGFLFFFYLINNIRTEYDLTVVTYGLCGACVIESAFMMVQFVAKKNYMLQGAAEYFTDVFRPVGFLSHPDACVILLSTAFPLLVIGLFVLKNVFKKFIIGSSILLILVAAGVSQTRIAAAIFGIGTVTALLISYRRDWISKGQMLLVTASLPVALLVFIFLASQRFATAAYGEERWPLAVTAYQIFKSYILFGAGPSNYNFVVERFIPASLVGKWVFTVHVEYLLKLAETGVIGFLVFYSFIITVTVKFYRLTFSKRPLIFLVSCGLFSSLVASFVHRMTSIYHIPQVFFLMCAVYALSVIVGSIEKSTVSQSGHQKFNQGFATEQEPGENHP